MPRQARGNPDADAPAEEQEQRQVVTATDDNENGPGPGFVRQRDGGGSPQGSVQGWRCSCQETDDAQAESAGPVGGRGRWQPERCTGGGSSVRYGVRAFP